MGGFCRSKETSGSYSPGAIFVSDVLEIAFDFAETVDYGETEAEYAWKSLMWALLAAGARILEIPESEIGGTCYPLPGGKTAIMLYDNVPGGAGHVLQLERNLGMLLDVALEIVTGCTCGENTCCYGCLSNYYNQYDQPHLSRGAAAMLLKSLFGD